jgi:hypothetical protein
MVYRAASPLAVCYTSPPTPCFGAAAFTSVVGEGW